MNKLQQPTLVADDVILPAVFAYLNWMDINTVQQVCHEWREYAVRAIVPSSSILPTIIGFLDWRDFLHARGTCTQWREAVKHTLVPPSVETRTIWKGGYDGPKSEDFKQFHVYNSNAYKMLDVMRKVIPNLQQIHLSKFQGTDPVAQMMPLGGYGDNNGVPILGYDDTDERYLDGEEAVEETLDDDSADTEEQMNEPPAEAYDVSIIAEFTKLRSLILNDAPLNGIYPCLFGFKHLRELNIRNGGCCHLKWDLKMLSGMPMIEKLKCIYSGATGSIVDLRFLKNSLRELTIVNAESEDRKIGGDFMDLSDFPSLEVLDLQGAVGVGGNASKLRMSDFPRIRKLDLPGVIQSLDNVPEIVCVLSHFAMRVPSCLSSLRLSENSPDHYGRVGFGPLTTFKLEFVKAGPRLGWRWISPERRWESSESCEINWLGSEPDADSNNFRVYHEEASDLESSVSFFKGIYNLPSAEVYQEMSIPYAKMAKQRNDDLINMRMGL